MDTSKTFSNKIRVWFKAFRLPFLTATIVPVVLGTVIAWHESGIINWKVLCLVLIGVSFFHTGTNLLNDYADHKTQNDQINKTPTPVSGGSRVIQEGLLTPKTVLISSLLLFAAGSLIGLYLVYYLQSLTILWIGVFGVFCGLFYSAFPLRIGYRGFGEIIVGFCFGPLVIFGSYFVQTLRWDITPVIASLPVAILIGLVLLVNEFGDHDADKAVGKRTLVVMFDRERSFVLYCVLLAVVYIYTFCCVLLRALPLYTIIIAITLPAAIRACTVIKNHSREAYALLPANFATISLHLSIGLLLSISFVLDRLL